jgi:hypothetical protein
LARELEELKLKEGSGEFKGTSRPAGDSNDNLNE